MALTLVQVVNATPAMPVKRKGVALGNTPSRSRRNPRLGFDQGTLANSPNST